jgi:hypothetical protein
MCLKTKGDQKKSHCRHLRDHPFKQPRSKCHKLTTPTAAYGMGGRIGTAQKVTNAIIQTKLLRGGKRQNEVSSNKSKLTVHQHNTALALQDEPICKFASQG